MDGLVEISTIFIALGLLGFLIKDIFVYFRGNDVPYELKTDTEKLFSYAAFAFLFILGSWLAFLLVYSRFPDVILIFKPIETGLNSLIGLGIISPSNALLNQAYLVVFSFTVLSVYFVYLFVTIAALGGLTGILSRYFARKKILITFSDNSLEPKHFKKIINESNDFIYLESFETSGAWVGIKKQDIKSIEISIVDSRFDTLCSSTCKNLAKKYPHIFQKTTIVCLFGIIVLLSGLVILISPNGDIDLMSSVVLALLFLVYFAFIVIASKI